MNLKKIRIEKKMSIYRLSKMSGISQSYIKEIEEGIKSPTVRVLDKLASTLDVSVINIIEGK